MVEMVTQFPENTTLRLSRQFDDAHDHSSRDVEDDEINLQIIKQLTTELNHD